MATDPGYVKDYNAKETFSNLDEDWKVSTATRKIFDFV